MTRLADPFSYSPSFFLSTHAINFTVWIVSARSLQRKELAVFTVVSSLIWSESPQKRPSSWPSTTFLVSTGLSAPMFRRTSWRSSMVCWPVPPPDSVRSSPPTPWRSSRSRCRSQAHKSSRQENSVLLLWVSSAALDSADSTVVPPPPSWGTLRSSFTTLHFTLQYFTASKGHWTLLNPFY